MKTYIINLINEENVHEEIEVLTLKEAKELEEIYRKDDYFKSVTITEYQYK